ncbi:transcription initiation factor TFIID subunit 10-like [Eupeodes corollae]|uniref:transcription initiation factor TFIID subunit 10-like n=1 Tax=Eupeodes corollae TaxID=290404 RepID=UPI00249221FC|nr:transcription initiation factor TFIID subunit 10-like [Eupeodes corollae]
MISGDNFGIYRGSSRQGQDDRAQGQVLSDFLMQLEDYVPTVPDAVTAHYLNSAGFESVDPRIVRLISVAAQKFISDVANDSLQHCKVRTNNQQPTSHGMPKGQKPVKDRKYTMTMEDLVPALSDYGITVRKPHYFV